MDKDIVLADVMWNSLRWGNIKQCGVGWAYREDSNRHRIYRHPDGTCYPSKQLTIDSGYDPNLGFHQKTISQFMKPVAKTTTSTHKKVSSSITVASKQVVEDDNSKMLDLTMDSSDELTEIADLDQEKEINGAEKTTGTLSHTSVSTQTTRRTGLVYKTKRQKTRSYPGGIR